ncbi:hypothetical protein Sjap_025851 [Stephania japonica]|uniref:Uncharacterized protein n=1 Tax=Stephania japonica TaxID=461633 RepID=A0AAP0HJX4_9MAGN
MAWKKSNVTWEEVGAGNSRRGAPVVRAEEVEEDHSRLDEAPEKELPLGCAEDVESDVEKAKFRGDDETSNET